MKPIDILMGAYGRIRLDSCCLGHILDGIRILTAVILHIEHPEIPTHPAKSGSTVDPMLYGDFSDVLTAQDLKEMTSPGGVQ